MSEIETIFSGLESIKEEISSAKQEKDQKTGQLSEQMKSLQSHKVKDIPGAEKKVTILQKKSKTLENKIITSFETLQESYEW